jgi:hypothetical protein
MSFEKRAGFAEGAKSPIVHFLPRPHITYRDQKIGIIYVKNNSICADTLMIIVIALASFGSSMRIIRYRFDFIKNSRCSRFGQFT